MLLLKFHYQRAPQNTKVAYIVKGCHSPRLEITFLIGLTQVLK